jgi:hypothetical protein
MPMGFDLHFRFNVGDTQVLAIERPVGAGRKASCSRERGLKGRKTRGETCTSSSSSSSNNNTNKEHLLPTPSRTVFDQGTCSAVCWTRHSHCGTERWPGVKPLVSQRQSQKGKKDKVGGRTESLALLRCRLNRLGNLASRDPCIILQPLGGVKWGQVCVELVASDMVGTCSSAPTTMDGHKLYSRTLQTGL